MGRKPIGFVIVSWRFSPSSLTAAEPESARVPARSLDRTEFEKSENSDFDRTDGWAVENFETGFCKVDSLAPRNVVVEVLSFLGVFGRSDVWQRSFFLEAVRIFLTSVLMSLGVSTLMLSVL